MSDITPLFLRDLHQSLGANFASVNGAEVVADYGDGREEHAVLRETAGVFDLGFRSRICLTGADRIRFLHGQVTNDVKKLSVGEGCYTALVTAKGKMQSDFNLFCLQDEVLLDFEPGLTAIVTQRLEKHIVADDVQIVDVTPHYGLLTVQGPKAETVVRSLAFFSEIPPSAFNSVKISDAALGEIYLMNHPRLGSTGFDFFVPLAALSPVADKLMAAAKSLGGRACGWNTFEIARVEAGIPRFGVDMDETNIASECGIEARAISYTKGCYIGQEVLNRIHSMGRVNRSLRRLRLAADLKTLPTRGDKLFHDGTEAGHITSAVQVPGLNQSLALGYVRREMNVAGIELELRQGANKSLVMVIG